MTRLRSRVLRACAAAIAAASFAAPAAAHPLGNATVSRGVAVTLAPTEVAVAYIVDMAEIPAFAAIQALDTDADGTVSTLEAGAYARAACGEALAGLALEVDEVRLQLEPAAESTLSFPPGVGGLETLRLECEASAPLGQPSGTVRVVDRRDDGRPGWREVTITAASGIALLESDVPASSPSAGLTRYPEGLLAAPIDVRTGTAVFTAGETPAVSAVPQAAVRPPTSDPLAALLTAQVAEGGGVGVLLALLVSVALGAAHALSPGHGKALVAAALVGSRGSARQAVGLGLTVAASHTVGVLVLGAVVLGAGTALAPDRLLAWMSLVAGGCVVAVGTALLARATLGLRHRNHDHHGSDDDHAHSHPHPHAHPYPGLATRSVIGLGLFGGLVPSSSAVIVLLLAVTTGQLLLGLALIVAFGLGMAGILGAFALLSTWLGRGVLEAQAIARRPVLARIGAAIPLFGAAAVVAAGTVMTLGALTQVL